MEADGTLFSSGDSEIDTLKRHMERHGLYALALSEVRLRGSGSLDVGDGFVLIFSGTPGDGSSGGVGWLLTPGAAAAWRDASSRAHGLSGRLLHISLALAGHEGVWHRVFIYGPTMQSTEDVKEHFWSQFEKLLQDIPNREVTFFLGDWNCRVGSRLLGGFPSEILGVHGLGPRNANGVELLSRAAAHGLVLLNSFFQHDLDHTASWIHRRWGTPGVIDHAVTRLTCQRFVTDVRAIPGAEHFSDHRLMVISLRAFPGGLRSSPQLPCSHLEGDPRSPRLRVARLRDPVVSANFTQAVLEAQAAAFANLPGILRRAGETTLGIASVSRPDWRHGHEDFLRNLADQRQRAFTSWKSDPCMGTREALVQARRRSRDETRRLKNLWWESRIAIIERASHGHDAATMYGESRQLGRLLSAQGMLSKPLVSDPAAQPTKLANHFETVLNVPKDVSPDVLGSIDSLPNPLPLAHWDPPTWEEFLVARGQLANGKAPDASGVHAELLRVLPSTGDGVLQQLHRLICAFWSGHIPQEQLILWKTSNLFALYKGKGDFADLQNFRGTVLLDTISKLTSRILKNKLLSLADLVCADQENGYRRGRGVADSCFCLRRCVEAWRSTDPDPPGNEDEDSLFLLFVDLRKAFDSVPRTFLWDLLQHKAAVPPHIIHVLKELHQDMTTQVVHNGRVGRKIPMHTGVRQGSVEGPVLYLIYYGFLLRQWRSACQEALPSFGIPWLSCTDGSLRAPARVKLAARQQLLLTDSVFADDTVLLAATWESFQQISLLLDKTLKAFGATLNPAKSEWTGHTASMFRDVAPLPGRRVLYIDGVGIPKTAEFKYLGSMFAIEDTLGIQRDVNRRLALAHAAFGQLRHVWNSRSISRRIKAQLLLSCVGSVLTYGSEHWTLSAGIVRRMTRTWQGFVRTALGLSWTQVRDQRLSFQVLLQQLGVPGLLTMLQRRLASWLGHIARLDPSRITWPMLFGTLADRRTPPATRQHSHLTYYSRVTALLQQLPDVDDRIWVRQAQRRDWWHTVVQKLEIAPQVRRTHTHDRYNLRALGRHVVGAPVDLRCPIDGCNFVARNAQGLTAHINYKHGHGEVLRLWWRLLLQLRADNLGLERMTSVLLLALYPIVAGLSLQFRNYTGILVLNVFHDLTVALFGKMDLGSFLALFVANFFRLRKLLEFTIEEVILESTLLLF